MNSARLGAPIPFKTIFSWGCLALAAIGTAPASAAIVVNDTLEDGRTNSPSNPLDAGFFGRFGIAPTTAADAVIGTGNALSINQDTTGSGPYMAVLDSAYAIPNVGHTIRLSFDFRLVTVQSSTTGFQFGLANSNGTVATGENSAASDNDNSYYASIATGTAAATVAMNEQLASANTRYGNAPTTGGFTTVGTDAPLAINDSLKHTASYLITRTGANTIQLQASIDGVVRATRDDSSIIASSFDAVILKAPFNDADFNVDNLVIDVVPEPASSGLIATGAMLLLARRRTLV